MTRKFVPAILRELTRHDGPHDEIYRVQDRTMLRIFAGLAVMAVTSFCTCDTTLDDVSHRARRPATGPVAGGHAAHNSDKPRL